MSSNSHSSIPMDGQQTRKPKWGVPNASAVAENAKKSAKRGVAAVSGVYSDFAEFLNRGNVFDLAVGVVMGAAFTSVVNSMVKDIFTPVISLGLDSVSLDNSFVILACPKNNGTNTRPSRSTCSSNFTTILQAQTAGAITWNWGVFLNSVLTFLVTAFIVYFMVKAYCAAFRRKKAEDTEKECQYCYKKIPIKALRCAFCTSNLDDDDDDHDDETFDPSNSGSPKPSARAMYYS